MKIVYLAGTLTGRNKKQVLQERKRATVLLQQAGFIVFDPVSIEKNQIGLKFKSDNNLATMAVYVRKEKNAIENCHALLVLTGDKPSDGTWYEMAFAKYKCKIPVVLVAKLRFQGKLVSWSNVEASAVVPSLAKAVQALKKLLATNSAA